MGGGLEQGGRKREARQLPVESFETLLGHFVRPLQAEAQGDRMAEPGGDDRQTKAREKRPLVKPPRRGPRGGGAALERNKAEPSSNKARSVRACDEAHRPPCGRFSHLAASSAQGEDGAGLDIGRHAGSKCLARHGPASTLQCSFTCGSVRRVMTRATVSSVTLAVP
jgi:hypothetical protein